MPKVFYLVWKDGYSVGVETLDHQHRQIFDTINALYNAILETSSNNQTAGVLDMLREYTRVHFAEEERLMNLCGYSGLPEQRAAHSRFIGEMDSLIARFDLHSADISYDLFTFLRRWWTGHIITMDTKYAPYLRKPHGSGPGGGTG